MSWICQAFLNLTIFISFLQPRRLPFFSFSSTKSNTFFKTQIKFHISIKPPQRSPIRIFYPSSGFPLYYTPLIITYFLCISIMVDCIVVVFATSPEAPWNQSGTYYSYLFHSQWWARGLVQIMRLIKNKWMNKCHSVINELSAVS